jgi:hypothetical protein
MSGINVAVKALIDKFVAEGREIGIQVSARLGSWRASKLILEDRHASATA